MDSPTPSSRFSIDMLVRLPLFWLSMAFLGGILFASQVNLPTLVWFIPAFLLLLVYILRRYFPQRLRIPLPPLMLLTISILFFGAARYQVTIPALTPSYIAWYNEYDYDLLITGVLAEPPDYRDTYTNLRLRVEAVDSGEGDQPVKGLLLARVDAGKTYHYGERLRLRGLLVTPPEGEEFSYRDFLARQGIHAYLPYAQVTRLPFPNRGNPILVAIYALKERSQENLYHIFSDPEASLMAGILLGVDTGMTADLQQAFIDTGTVHIIAISGFNITLIAGLIVMVFSRLLGPRRGAIMAVVVIFIYTLLVGAQPSVVRAAIMGGLGLFARQVGRRQHALNTLIFTAAIMGLINPHTPWDVGFQLSFFATLGLILYAQPFQDWATRLVAHFFSLVTPGAASINTQRIAKLISEYILFTLAAQLTTFPIIAYHFQRISLVSLLANPFILPVQPAVMVLGGLALLLSLLYLPIGRLAAWLAWPFSAYTTHAVELFARLPHGVLVLGEFSLLFVILFYALLLSWTFAGHHIKAFFSTQAGKRILAPASILSVLGLLTILVWRAVFAAPDGRLHLTFLDVGSADAILIQTPGGQNILINGGNSPSRLSDSLGRRFSPFNRHLDWLVLASTQEDQVGSLPRTIERFPPEAVLWAGKVEASYPARQMDQWLAENPIPLTRAAAGQVMDLGSAARMEVLIAGPRGAVLLIEWGNFRALLPIGINFDGLEELHYGASIAPVSLLLLADSGYAPLNPPEWIDHLRPQLILLSVAAGDPNGLPAPETLEHLEDYTLLRTDQNGWIDVTTDGKRMWVQVEKNP